MKRLLILSVIIGIGGFPDPAGAQEVKINTNLVVEGDGTIRREGAATVWDDIMVFPDAAGRRSGNPPSWSLSAFKKNATGTSQGVFLWMFSPVAEQELHFIVQIPHGYKEGSALYPHVHWTTSNETPSGTNVVWGLEYTVVDIGGSFPNTNILTGNSIIPTIGTPSGPGQHLVTQLGVISGTGLGISSILVCRLYRATANVSDTFGSEVGLLGFDIHYEKDTDGSRTEFVK